MQRQFETDGSGHGAAIEGLKRSVAAALREIAGAERERELQPVRAARLRLAAVYGATRLQRRLEREHA